ncbi:hypothetical protein GCM10022224_095610 [Nonomuraea antimicrobica]|uniref:Uncharacterized protein n=1 Tax=Nonomuraea antimicrobica TaxID=561173 RepID=A0ABP7E8P7_9ACTN
MDLDGVAYSPSNLNRLACAADGMAGDVFGVRSGFETSWGVTRTALGDDDYARTYLQAKGGRVESIATGLSLLVATLLEHENKLGRASATYEACEDASTLRG